MRADRRVQFERYTATDDGFGQVQDWTAHGSPVPAERRDVSDGEKARAGEVQATLMTRFIVRWSPFSADITPKDRLTTEGRAFNIVGAKESGGRRRYIELTCVARND